MTEGPEYEITHEFLNNKTLPLLFGAGSHWISKVERLFGIQIHTKGNLVKISGRPDLVHRVLLILKSIYQRLDQGDSLEDEELDLMLRTQYSGSPSLERDQVVGSENAGSLTLVVPRRYIKPRTLNQEEYLKKLKTSEIVFGVGPAGTGKTYLAVAKAVSLLLDGSVERIVLTRPAVEAGERLGFLPGDLKGKIDPYIRPLYDALADMLTPEILAKRMNAGDIEVAPLAFMRGRTLSKSFIILDEAQNTTAEQMKMFLTRLGFGSRMVLNGDLTQVDLPKGVRSGLRDAIDIVAGIADISVVHFNETDVIRHPLVAKVVRAYDEAGLGRGSPYA